MLPYLLAWLVLAIAWGITTYLVIHNRGYEENWFWWGFFFNIFAVIVAFSKPQLTRPSATSYPKVPVPPAPKNADEDEHKKGIIASGGWQCSCGTVNYPYVTTCPCGKSKFDV